MDVPRGTRIEPVPATHPLPDVETLQAVAGLSFKETERAGGETDLGAIPKLPMTTSSVYPFHKVWNGQGYYLGLH